MPPPAPTPWRALAIRPKAPSATRPLPTARLFHTTPALAMPDEDVPVPPESPRFFSLPDLPQSDETKLPLIKGALPVPRKLFTKRAAGAHKSANPARFVENTAPLSQRELDGAPPKSDKDAWKRLMAASRREALGDGITSLWRRKVHRDRKLAGKAREHQQRNRAAGFAPDRADEVHTRPTVTQATLITKVERDPQYAERQRASAVRTAALAAAKSEARKDAVQRLYVEASRFIVTEADLAARVDEIFTDLHFKATGTFRGIVHARNKWQQQGVPRRVGQMYGELMGKTIDMGEAYEEKSSKTAQRQKIIAGELTGGALSILAPN